MKVWVALHMLDPESSDFMCVAESMDAAKRFVGSGRNWVDSTNGTDSTAMEDEFSGYYVFETEVVS